MAQEVLIRYEADVNSYLASTKKIKQDQAEIIDQQDEINKEGSKGFKQASTAAQGASKSIDQVSTSSKNAGNNLSKTIQRFVAFGAVVARARKTLIFARDAIVNYEQAIADLGAITGATGDQLQEFSSEVLRVSRNTGKSAIDIADAFKLVGSAQPELLESAQALGAVSEQAVILAQAGGLTVPQAAEALTKSLNQFGGSAIDAAEFTDILATSQQRGTANIQLLSEALKNAGSVANDAGLTFEETNVALQALAKGGIAGAEAGTGLRAVLLRLQKAGIGFRDGQFEIAAAVEETAEILDNTRDPIERVTVATELFGDENVKTINTLIAQRGVIDELTGALNDEGNALEQAATRTATFTGILEENEAVNERFFIALTEGSGTIANFVRDVGNLNNSIGDFFTTLVQGNEKVFDTIFTTQEYKTQLGLLINQFKSGELSATEYRDSLLKLRNAGQLLIDSSKEQTKATEDQEKQQRRTVQVIDDEIAAQQKLLQEQSSRAGASQIQQRIELLEKEKESILGASEETTKSNEKAIRERERRLREEERLAREALELQNRIDQERIRQIEDNEERAIAERLNSLDIQIQNIGEAGEKEAELIKVLTENTEADLEEIRAKFREERRKAEEEALKEADEATEALIKLSRDAAEERTKIEEEEERLRQERFDRRVQLTEEFAEVGALAFTAFTNLQAQQDQDALASFEANINEREKLLEDTEANRSAIAAQRATLEEEQRRREQEQLRQQAIFDKSFGIFQAGLNTAVSITKTAATLGFPAATPFIVTASLLGAAQIAAIATQPIPTFAEGVIGLHGPGTTTSDSIPAMLSRGESVMTANETVKFRPELEAMRNDQFEGLIMAKYVLPALKAQKSAYDTGKQNDMAKAMVKEMASDHLSEQAFLREMKRQRLTQADFQIFLAEVMGSQNNSKWRG